MKIKLKKFKVVESTNNVAIRLINKNITKPTLIVAKRQTGGRGRIGKNGFPRMEIYFSLFTFV